MIIGGRCSLNDRFQYVQDIQGLMANVAFGSETEVQGFLILAVGVVPSSTQSGRLVFGYIGVAGVSASHVRRYRHIYLYPPCV